MNNQQEPVKKINFNPELYEFDVHSHPQWMIFQSRGFDPLG
jgi:hypothetical protein